MTASKHFLTFSQQVESLKNEKHIEIPDSQYAEKILQRIGYFSLMGGYKQLFRIPFTKKYRPGTNFDEIVALYQFDADLRELFLKYLLQIERHIGNLMAYYFIDAHGISQKEYMNPDNYNNIPLWITTSVLTFESLSKMYNVLPQSLRSKICRHFPAVNQRQLERYLSVLTKY